jgi:DNA-directed RNA polymerase specialized sigma24 family protein
MEDIFEGGISLNLSVERREDFVCRAYEEHRSAVYRHMVALGLDTEAAQDFTQETFLSLFESLCKGQRIDRLRPWLFAVASRIAVRHLERLRGEAILKVPDMAELISAVADSSDGPEKSLLAPNADGHWQLPCRRFHPNNGSAYTCEPKGFVIERSPKQRL